MFEVKHFSKYRLEDSDDEGEHNIQHPSNATDGRKATLEVDNTRQVGV